MIIVSRCSRHGWFVAIVVILVGATVIARADGQVWVWSPPALVDPNAATDAGTNGYSAHLATDGAGTWIVTWDARNLLGGTLGNDFDAVFSRSTDGGVTWSASAALNDDATVDAADDRHPRMAGDAAGTWIGVWEYFGSGDAEIRFARSTDGGVTWGTSTLLNTNAPLDDAEDFDPQITSDGSGTWVAVWMSIPSSFGANFDVLFARSIDDGLTWSAPAALNPSGGSPGPNELNPSVTTDDLGTWIATWDSDDSFGGTLSGRHVVYARSTDGGATWSTPDVLDGGSPMATYADFPQVATDGAGVWIATWSKAQSLQPRFDILVARSTDGGITWSTPTALVSMDYDPADPFQPVSRIATDSSSTWVVVWEHLGRAPLGATFGTDLDILFARSDDGGVTWKGPGAVNTNAAGDAGDDAVPQIAADALGNWVATWTSAGTEANLMVARGMPRVCSSAPETGCRLSVESGASVLKMKDQSGYTKDKIQWNWKKGAITPKAAFGNPLSAEGHLFCLYDAGSLITAAAMDAAGMCGPKACWKQSSHGFKFKDKELTPDGAQLLKLKEGAEAGKASVTFKAKGQNVAMPSLAGLTGPLVVQLQQGSDAECWQSTFSVPFLKNDGVTFKDTAD